MNIKVEQISNSKVSQISHVKISGDLDMHESPKLRQTLALETSKKPNGLIVDFAELNFIDSSGIATLIEALKGLQNANCKLVLTNMAAKILDVFQLARLDKVFHIKTNIDDSLKFLSGE